MITKRFLILMLAAVVAFAGMAGPAWALGAEVDTARGVAIKLLRGVVNAATGWVEIPKQMSLVWQESGAGPGMSWGLIKGIGFAVARSVVGGYEIATFPMPIPDGYRPIMQPEYVFSDMQLGGGGAEE